MLGLVLVNGLLAQLNGRKSLLFDGLIRNFYRFRNFDVSCTKKHAGFLCLDLQKLSPLLEKSQVMLDWLDQPVVINDRVLKRHRQRHHIKVIQQATAVGLSQRHHKSFEHLCSNQTELLQVGFVCQLFELHTQLLYLLVSLNLVVFKFFDLGVVISFPQRAWKTWQPVNEVDLALRTLDFNLHEVKN